MRDYGKVSPQFWVGQTGKDLRGNLQAQVVALYLMTSPHANMIGVYYCPVEYIAKETGIPLEGASEALRRLAEGDFCTYDASSEYVCVHRFAACQIGETLKAMDKRVQGVINELAKVPKNQCWQAFRARYAVPYHLPVEGQKPGKSKPHRSPIGAPPKPEAEAEAEAEDISAEALAGSALATGFAIPLNDGTDWPVPPELLEEWRTAFPAADVEQELREMRVWSSANAANRKTLRGVAAFAVRWLQKAQDAPNHPRPSQRAGTLAGAI